jgi:hypothetical protein
MDLPLQRGERRKIIRPVRLDPGKPVAGDDLTSLPFTQGAVVVRDVDLRDSSKEQPAHCWKTKQGRRDGGNEPRSDDARNLTLTRHDRETPISRLDEPPREGDSLGFVGIE